MREPVFVSIPVGILVEYEGIEWSPADIPKAEVGVLNSTPSAII